MADIVAVEEKASGIKKASIAVVARATRFQITDAVSLQKSAGIISEITHARKEAEKLRKTFIHFLFSFFIPQKSSLFHPLSNKGRPAPCSICLLYPVCQLCLLLIAARSNPLLPLLLQSQPRLSLL